MAGTNPDGEQGGDDADQAAEDALRAVKYPEDDVETPKGADEPADGDDLDEDDEEADDADGQTDGDDNGDDDSEGDDKPDSDDDDSYVKEFPNIKGDTLPDYARNLEDAYKNSTAEALRLKRENDELKAKDSGEPAKVDDKTDGKPGPSSDDPLRMWAQQSLDQEITKAYDDFTKLYPQVTDPVHYEKFQTEVATLSRTILDSQKRLAPPRELYSKAAVILGWEAEESAPNKSDKLKIALKDGAAISKSNSGTKKTPKSKVSDRDIEVYRKMNPSDDKSDSDIRQELEAYV